MSRTDELERSNAALVAALKGLLMHFVKPAAYPDFEAGGKNDEFIDLATAETMARQALADAKNLPPAETAPIPAEVNERGVSIIEPPTPNLCPHCGQPMP